MVIDVIGAFCILLLIISAFLGGMATANWYNEKARREEEYALKVQYSRMRAGVDFYDPTGPYVCKWNGRAGGPPSVRNPYLSKATAGAQRRESTAFNCSQLKEFEERLNKTGKATVLLNKK